MRKMPYVAGAIIVLGGLWFAYYAISPIFTNVRLDETAPSIQSSESTSSGTDVALGAPIVGTTGHPASGTVRVVNTDNQTYIRYENFKTLNGPDLYVYLAKDLDAREYVNLGALKATEGNINYLVPSEIDISDYSYALIWCKQFGVLFNSADISTITARVK